MSPSTLKHTSQVFYMQGKLKVLSSYIYYTCDFINTSILHIYNRKKNIISLNTLA